MTRCWTTKTTRCSTTIHSSSHRFLSRVRSAEMIPVPAAAGRSTRSATSTRIPAELSADERRFTQMEAMSGLLSSSKQRTPSLFEKGDCLFLGNARKVVKELVDRLAAREVVKQRLHRN